MGGAVIFRNEVVSSTPEVRIPGSAFGEGERTFAVLFKKPDKWSAQFAIIGSQIIEV